MSTKIKVTLGPNAYSFNDQSTGLSIASGDIKELTPRQASTVRVKRALSQGHLQLVVEASAAKKYTAEQIAKLTKKLNAQYEKGMEISKVAKGYSLEEIQLIAKELGYEVEKEDTAETLLATIFEEFAAKSEEK